MPGSADSTVELRRHDLPEIGVSFALPTSWVPLPPLPGLTFVAADQEDVIEGFATNVLVAARSNDGQDLDDVLAAHLESMLPMIADYELYEVERGLLPGGQVRLAHCGFTHGSHAFTGALAVVASASFLVYLTLTARRERSDVALQAARNILHTMTLSGDDAGPG